MSSIVIKFDPIEYVQKARKNGFSQEQAEFSAQELEKILEQQAQIISEHADKLSKVESKELATKGDIRESELRLEKEIALIESRLTKWVIGVGIGAVITLGGMLGKGFHWW